MIMNAGDDDDVNLVPLPRLFRVVHLVKENLLLTLQYELRFI